MTEGDMIRLSQKALDDRGIQDTVVAVGQFQPRGHSGSSFAGGMLGSELGEIGGSLGEGIALGAGFIGGGKANAAASGLPEDLIIAVSAAKVYGMHSRSRRAEPDDILFAVPREHLTAEVHQRVNVRVLELIDAQDGTRIELEGNRLPITHSKDVIDVLTQGTDGS